MQLNNFSFTPMLSQGSKYTALFGKTQTPYLKAKADLSKFSTLDKIQEG